MKKPKFRVGQVVFDKELDQYSRVWSASYPYRSQSRTKGHFVINAAPESRFRPLTRREMGLPRKRSRR
jgi:hypothetical protein